MSSWRVCGVICICVRGVLVVELFLYGILIQHVICDRVGIMSKVPDWDATVETLGCKMKSDIAFGDIDPGGCIL